MKSSHLLTVAILALALVAPAVAQPFLTVTPSGLNPSGNRLWIADVFPDPDLFANNPPNGFGGSVALEIAFQVVGSDIVSIVKNATNFEYDNSGNNPFSGTITHGIQFTPPGSGNVFTALGSTYFTAPGPHEIFTLETQGSALTTVSWGVAVTGQAGNGTIIAQAAQIYDGQTGVAVAVPEPASLAFAVISISVMGIILKRR